MTQPPPLEYATRPKVSALAVASMILGLVSLPLFFLGIPALVALLFAWIAGFYLSRRPDQLGGEGYLQAGRWLSLASLFLFVAFMLMLPSFGHRCSASKSTYCAYNLRGILQSINIYANDNGDQFPLVPYAPYTAALNNPSSSLGTADADDTLKAMYNSPPANIAGSPSANAWQIVLKSYTSPKQFVCRSDPFVSKPADVTDAGRYHMNFAGSNLSYSFAYPWTANGKRAWWWTNIMDAGLPLMSDIAPLQGTGTPRRVLNPSAGPSDNRTWNSPNHNGEGQNVGFSDAHVEWVRTPTVGHANDNIFTTSATGAPQEFGGTPATPLFPLTPPLPAGTTEPASREADILMLPVRNATTGAM